MNLKKFISFATLISISISSHAQDSPKPYKEIKTKEEYQKVLRSGKPVVVKFYAPWCGACNMMEPYFCTVANNLRGQCNFISINVDEPGLAEVIKEKKIEAVPTTMVLKNGKEATTIRGSREAAQLEKEIKKVL